MDRAAALTPLWEMLAALEVHPSGWVPQPETEIRPVYEDQPRDSSYWEESAPYPKSTRMLRKAPRKNPAPSNWIAPP